jgi:hypothetical protein
VGLTVTVPHGDGSISTVSLVWSEVTGVVVYKRDCYGVDLICAGFVTNVGAIEVNEEMKGWTELMNCLPTHLPGAVSETNWWKAVALPPFAANPTTIFSPDVVGEVFVEPPSSGGA